MNPTCVTCSNDVFERNKPGKNRPGPGLKQRKGTSPSTSDHSRLIADTCIESLLVRAPGERIWPLWTLPRTGSSVERRTLARICRGPVEMLGTSSLNQAPSSPTPPALSSTLPCLPSHPTPKRPARIAKAWCIPSLRHSAQLFVLDRSVWGPERESRPALPRPSSLGPSCRPYQIRALGSKSYVQSRD